MDDRLMQDHTLSLKLFAYVCCVCSTCLCAVDFPVSQEMKSDRTHSPASEWYILASASSTQI